MTTIKIKPPSTIFKLDCLPATQMNTALRVKFVSDNLPTIDIEVIAKDGVKVGEVTAMILRVAKETTCGTEKAKTESESE